MSKRVPQRKRHAALSDNVLRQEAGRHKLSCGHETNAHPIATYASGEKLYVCPQGCEGLQHGARGR